MVAWWSVHFYNWKGNITLQYIHNWYLTTPASSRGCGSLWGFILSASWGLYSAKMFDSECGFSSDPGQSSWHFFTLESQIKYCSHITAALVCSYQLYSLIFMFYYLFLLKWVRDRQCDAFMWFKNSKRLKQENFNFPIWAHPRQPSNVVEPCMQKI